MFTVHAIPDDGGDVKQLSRHRLESAAKSAARTWSHKNYHHSFIVRDKAGETVTLIESRAVGEKRREAERAAALKIERAAAASFWRVARRAIKGKNVDLREDVDNHLPYGRDNPSLVDDAWIIPEIVVARELKKLESRFGEDLADKITGRLADNEIEILPRETCIALTHIFTPADTSPGLFGDVPGTVTAGLHGGADYWRERLGRAYAAHVRTGQTVIDVLA